MYHGNGILYTQGEEHFSYDGGWENNVRKGLGTFIWSNSDTYTGNFDKGTFHGEKDNEDSF